MLSAFSILKLEENPIGGETSTEEIQNIFSKNCRRGRDTCGLKLFFWVFEDLIYYFTIIINMSLKYAFLKISDAFVVKKLLFLPSIFTLH
jgi:hypothetical protein